MASPENEVTIDLWIRNNVEGSAADVAAVRAQLMMWADRAEQGDRQAQRSLSGLHGGGITITPPAPALAAPRLGGQEPTIAPEDFGDPGFQGLRAPTGAGGPQPGVPQQGPMPGTFTVLDPTSGTGFIYRNQPVLDDFGDPTGETEAVVVHRFNLDDVAAGVDPLAKQFPRWAAALGAGHVSPGELGAGIRGELGLGAEGGEFSDRLLRDLTFAAQRAEEAGNPELAAQYRARIQQVLLGTGGGGGLTEFQSGQLDIQRGQLQLSREQSAITAARAGNPLAFLGLTTGKTPQEALSLVPPAPSQVTIQRGDPLGRARLSGGLRLPGVQALARETPTEAAARRERQAVEFGLSPEESMAFAEERKRRAGPRLRAPTFGGSIGR